MCTLLNFGHPSLLAPGWTKIKGEKSLSQEQNTKNIGKGGPKLNGLKIKWAQNLRDRGNHAQPCVSFRLW